MKAVFVDGGFRQGGGSGCSEIGLSGVGCGRDRVAVG